MWIYQKTEKGASLINMDHVSKVYVNKSAVYAMIGDCDIERVIGLASEEEAVRFMGWLATRIHYSTESPQIMNISKWEDTNGKGD